MSDKLEAVRKAIAAYAEALEAIKRAAPHVPGSCVMTRSNYSGYYTCSECKGTGSAGAKFCAGCGAEIIRFDDLNQPRDYVLHVSQPEVKITKIKLPELDVKHTTRSIRLPNGKP